MVTASAAASSATSSLPSSALAPRTVPVSLWASPAWLQRLSPKPPTRRASNIWRALPEATNGRQGRADARNPRRSRGVPPPKMYELSGMSGGSPLAVTGHRSVTGQRSSYEGESARSLCLVPDKRDNGVVATGASGRHEGQSEVGFLSRESNRI